MGTRKIFTPYITKNGIRIYHPKGKLFVFEVTDKEYEEYLKQKKDTK